jgi:MFS family permease
LLASSLVSFISVWMQRLVIGWLILTLSDNPLVIASAFAARSLPNLLFGAFGGAVADRFSRKRLLIIVQSATTMLSVATGILAISAEVSPWMVIAVSFCFGAAQSFDNPARQALVYDLTSRDTLMNALSLNEVCRRAMSVVGPLVGGWLIEAFGLGRVFLLMAALTAAGMSILALVRAPALSRSHRRERVLQSLWEGVRVIAGNPVTAWLVALTMACEIFAFSYMAMMPIFAHNVLQVGAAGYGYMTAAAGLGAVLGATILAALGNYQRKGWLLCGAFLLFGVSIVAVAMSTWFPLTLVFLLGVGLAGCAFDTLQQTLLQENVPEDMRGRAMGAWVLAIGMGPVGSLYLGAVAGTIGAPLAVGINGAVVVLLAISTAMFLSRVRRLA